MLTVYCWNWCGRCWPRSPEPPSPERRRSGSFCATPIPTGICACASTAIPAICKGRSFPRFSNAPLPSSGREHYGGPHGVAVAERLFHLDSQLCLELLPLVTGDDRAERRWQLALAGTVRLLSGLGFNTADQKALAEILRDDREENWVVDDTYRQQLASKFRSAEMRSTLAAILAWCEDQPGTNAAQGGSSSAEPTIPDEAMSALLRYSRSLPAIREELRTLEQDGRLTATMAQLAASYVHMHLNRIFRACHLEQEAVLCDLLARACASKLAQERRTR